MSKPTIEEFPGMDEHLRVLGLRGAGPFTTERVKKAWRDLCRTHHPDKGGDGEEFRRVTHAYESLTNPEYRAKNRGLKTKSLNIAIPVPLEFSEVFFGASFPITYSVTEVDEKGVPWRKEKLELETLTINLTPGCFGEMNKPVIFSKKGLRCGDKRGDVILTFMVQEHPKFKIGTKKTLMGEMLYVYSVEKIPLNKCLRGGRLDVQTMHGVKRLRIPAGTRPGDELRIKKAGLMGGDHIITVDVYYPTKREVRQKDYSFLGVDWKKEDDLDESEMDTRGVGMTRLLRENMGWG